MAKGQSKRQRDAVIAALQRNKGPVSLGDLAKAAGATTEQLKTVLGQLKGQVRCVSKETMDSQKSMNWFHVDSRWDLVR